MDQSEWLSAEFEAQRTHLGAVAYRMLGSVAEAEDAVQDTWLRVSRAGADDVDNLGGWMTTVLARVCLNMLRSRARRREEPLEYHVPDPVVSPEGGPQPEAEALLADSIGLALLVVLDTLTPAERLAFVLHDLFDLPYQEIAEMVDRSPTATRQLASRARRRVQSAEVPESDRDRSRQRDVVDAFFAAARGGDLGALVSVLHPEVVFRLDAGSRRPALSMALRGADAVAAQTMRGLASSLGRPGVELHPAVVNGNPGVVATSNGRPLSIIGFVLSAGRIVEIDAVADPDRVQALAAPITGR
jgi:RNA polymerase sigma factor (sigma-70 family)